MVNNEWSGAEALENAFRVADGELRKVERERDEAVARADEALTLLHFISAETGTPVDEIPGLTLSSKVAWYARSVNPAVTRDEVWRVVAAHDPGDDEMALCRVNRLTDAVCRLFGVEAKPADPVEALAGQIESAARTAIRQVCDDLATVAPSLDPLAVERAMELASASRKVAAHILGQETGQ